VRIVTAEEMAEFRACFFGAAETLAAVDARIIGARSARVVDGRIAACDPSQSAWVTIVRSGIRSHWRWLPFAEIWIKTA